VLADRLAAHLQLNGHSTHTCLASSPLAGGGQLHCRGTPTAAIATGETPWSCLLPP
jgi:hypothetical protein